jgi:16S rRNA (uracil1498-N3)-methyltransferase
VTSALFLVDEVPGGGEFLLGGAEGHHAATVQRLRMGEALLLGDGRGTTAPAEVVGVGKGALTVRVGERSFEAAPEPRLAVVQGLPKGDRGELAVQAMTEVGVDEIVPWAASRSVTVWRDERGEKARQRWVDTAREATKQARRPWLPRIGRLASTKDIAHPASGERVSAVLVLHEEATERLTTVELPAYGEIRIVVGPEGGLAPAELELLAAAGAQLVRLGPSVLRTSTAGVAALSVLSTRLGRW